MPMCPLAKPNAASHLERYRRRISRMDPNNPQPHFTLLNVEIVQLFILYREYFPSEVADILGNLTDNELREIVEPYSTLKYQSPVFSYLPLFKQYNALYAEHEDNLDKKERYGIKYDVQQYIDKVIYLTNELSSNTQTEFYNCIRSVRGTSSLHPHLDTLLFVCVFFYNMIWNVYGIYSTDGTVEKYTSKRYHEHFDRVIDQSNFLGKLLSDYIKNPTKLGEVNFLVGGKVHLTQDPIMVGWIVKLIKDAVANGNYPVSLDYMGETLRQTLQRPDNQKEITILELESIANNQAPKFKDNRRKAIKAFCLNIHKVFAHYMGKSPDKFYKTQLTIYHNILKLFFMDDFSEPRREREKKDNESTRKDTIENRLGELLRRPNDH